MPLKRLTLIVIAACLSLGAVTVPASAIIVSNRYTAGDLWVCPQLGGIGQHGVVEYSQYCVQAPFGETQMPFQGPIYTIRAYLRVGPNAPLHPHDNYLCQPGPAATQNPAFWNSSSNTILFGDGGCAVFDSSGRQVGRTGQNRF